MKKITTDINASSDLFINQRDENSAFIDHPLTGGRTKDVIKLLSGILLVIESEVFEPSFVKVSCRRFLKRLDELGLELSLEAAELALAVKSYAYP